ncbi:MAG TPA: radical SAM protein [Planctomycetota bacterium]|nr:radical SAM protein [Planctomycetota bacterium]
MDFAPVAASPDNVATGESGSSRPLYKVFSTDSGHYLYDTATNQILTVPEDFARHLAEGAFSQGELDEMAADPWDGVLVPTSGLPLTPRLDRATVESAIQGECKQLILEATRDCNLRCKYCLYSGRQPGRRGTYEQHMAPDTARKAVDYLAAHSSRCPEVIVGFYGGEPLLNPSLMRATAEYARRTITDKKLTLTLTTNGTLLNRETMDFLAANEFFVYVSMDGPREANDRNRVFAGSGEGTSDLVVARLREFQRLYPDYCRRSVGFSVVIAPGADLARMAEWAGEWDLALATVTRASDDTGELEEAFRAQPVTGYEQLKAQYIEAARTGTLPQRRGRIGFALHTALFSIGLSTLRKRAVPTSPHDRAIRRGICIPSKQRLFVDCNGDLFPCEKTDGFRHLHLGHVDTGVDARRAYDIIVGFHEFLAEECASCWLWRLCPVCFVGATVGNAYARDKARRVCEMHRREMADTLKTYCTILEHDPGALDCFLDSQADLV